MVDAYRALDYLAKHQMVDPSRIAVMGFSHGGPSALYSSIERFRQMYGSSNRFAGHISVYGFCNTSYHGDDKMAAPVLMLHGGADDLISSAACRAYAARSANAGNDARFIEYLDAHHAFDATGLRQPVKMAKARTSRNCKLAEGDDGAIMNAESRQPFGPNDSCFETGTTMAYHEEAHRKAQQDVKAFLQAVLIRK